MRWMGLSGSLRRGSYNTALLRASASLAPDGVALQIYDYRDVPLYDADLEDPPAVLALREAVAAADALVIATPEYNHSVPGVLKNAIDWASRPAMSSSLKGKPVLILSASPGALGGVRAQAHLRAALASTLSHVFPWPEIVVTHAKGKLVDGELVDETTRAFVAKALVAFHDYVGRWR